MLPKAIVLIILAFVIAIFGVIACESYRLIAAVVTESRSALRVDQQFFRERSLGG
jgi:hypothetical protein